MNTPAMTWSDIVPADFNYHQPADDAELQTHREELQIVVGEATRRANREIRLSHQL